MVLYYMKPLTLIDRNLDNSGYFANNIGGLLIDRAKCRKYMKAEYGMKLVLEISSMGSGSFNHEDKEIKWVRLAGKDKEGRYSVAQTKGYVAESIIREIGKMLVPGEEISSRRFIVDLTGQWVDGKPWEKDGRTIRNRYFSIASFNILHGPVLELNRVRREAAEVVSTALEIYKGGDVHSAFRTLLDHAAKISGTAIDMQQFEKVVDELDELEFGIVDPVTTDNQSPEAVAAAKFAAMDRLDGFPTAAATISNERTVEEVSALSSDEPAEEVAPVSQETAEEQLEQQEAQTHEIEERDVLDDPVEPDEVAQQTENDDVEAEDAPRSRLGSPFGRPFGSPTNAFGRPGI